MLKVDGYVKVKGVNELIRVHFIDVDNGTFDEISVTESVSGKELGWYCEYDTSDIEKIYREVDLNINAIKE